MDIEKLKVADLKKELKARGLSSLGVKSELMERLQQALQSDTGSSEAVDDDVNEDEFLNEDDMLSEPEKSAELLISEDIILSPEQKPKPVIEIFTEKENTVQQNNGNNSPVKTEEKYSKIVFPTTVKILTPKERMELRAKKFNAPVPEAVRKEARAQRFGTPSKTQNVTAATSVVAVGKPAGNNLEKLKIRANRFGSSVSGSLKKVEESDRLKKRKERFGAVTAAAKLTADDVESKRQKRAERFGIK